MERHAERGSRRSAETRPSSPDAAFDRYVVPQISALRRRARGLTGASPDTDDLVQETLLRAYRAIARFDGRHPRAWLYTIMRHAWINEHRKLRPIPIPVPESLPTSARSGASAWGVPEDDLAQEVMDADLEAALDHLPRHYRVVVEAVTVKGLSCHDAATALSIPVGTVLSRLHRARAALREELCGSRSTNLAGPRAVRRAVRYGPALKHGASHRAA